MNLRLLAFFVAVALPVVASAKPPPPARPSPVPASATDAGPGSLLSWLLIQNGSPGAASIPWPEAVRAAGGKQVTPLDRTDASDAAMIAKLGSTLDRLLPRANRPDGPLRTTLTTAEVAARVADELCVNLDAESLGGPAAACPVLRWRDSAGGRTYYLAVAAYPVGGKESAVRALTVRPGDLAGQITTDASCLLVGLEYNGKPGRDLALINWALVDLARVSLRCSITFEADADALHAPGATLGDGRRGRD